MRAALRPGVGANVAVGQAADEAEPQAPIGSPGTILNRLDMLAGISRPRNLNLSSDRAYRATCSTSSQRPCGIRRIHLQSFTGFTRRGMVCEREMGSSIAVYILGI